MDIPRIRQLTTKIRSGKPVRIAVFCAGNGDRSPLAQQVLQSEFARRGFGNVTVTSFGISPDPEKNGGPASEIARRYAAEHGYGDIEAHRRRSLGSPAVQKEVEGADLLLGVSEPHGLYLAEYFADSSPPAAAGILRRSWTLRGFAHRTQWTAPLVGISRAVNRLYRGTSSRDPYFAGSQGRQDDVNRMFDTIVADSKRCVDRLAGKRTPQ